MSESKKYKRTITPAVIAAKQKHYDSVKQIHVRLKKDSDLLEWLRSQVEDDSEIPSLIKDLLTQIKQGNC